MEKALKDCLREQEEVCWQGMPVEFSLLDGANTRPILLKWILTVAIAGGILIPYLNNNREAVSMGFIGLLALVVALILVSPVIERWSLRQQRYWITNQRAILMSRDKSIYYMELDEIDEFKLVTDMAAGQCLVLGGCLFPEIHKQLRWRACHPKIDMQSTGQGGAMGLVFYSVSNADAAAALLEKSTGRAAA